MYLRHSFYHIDWYLDERLCIVPRPRRLFSVPQFRQAGKPGMHGTYLRAGTTVKHTRKVQYVLIYFTSYLRVFEFLVCFSGVALPIPFVVFLLSFSAYDQLTSTYPRMRVISIRFCWNERVLSFFSAYSLRACSLAR